VEPRGKDQGVRGTDGAQVRKFNESRGTVQGFEEAQVRSSMVERARVRRFEVPREHG